MSGNIALQTTTVSVREFAGTVDVPISRTGDPSAAVSVEYLVSAVSATDGADFSGGTGTVTIPAGASSAVITVPIIDDGAGEPTETFQVSLVRASSGTLLAPRTAIVSVLDDETPVVEPVAPPFISSYEVATQIVLDGLDQPISIEFTDDGRAYVAEKAGRIKLYDLETGALLSTVLDISEVVNEAGDRGLLDIALAPDFDVNKELWAVYVVDPPETDGLTGPAGPDGIGNRYVYLSRFELTADGLTALPGSEVVLIGGAGQSLGDISGGGALDFTAAQYADNVSSAVDPTDPTGFKQDYWKVDAQSHMGGSIEFGPDGALYVTTGDGGSYNIPDRRNIEVQSIDSLTGKVLRIDPMTGEGLADNPFATGDLSANRSKVFSLGQRNPYTLAIDDSGRIITADTGWGQAEEINISVPGSNFGWPFYEGGDGVNLVTPRYDIYPEQQGFFDAEAAGEFVVTPPFKGFSRSASDPGYLVQAIVGADGVHEGDAYPASLDDHYVFTDVARTNVFALNLNDPTDVKYLYTTGGLIGPVYFEPGPDGAIHAVDLVSGTVERLIFEEASVTVALNGSATYDAEDGAFRLTGSSGGFYPGTAGSRFQAGSANIDEALDLSADFAITAELYFGADPGGGDGLAFVIHGSDETALGRNGGAVGAVGIDDGLALAFDTYSSPSEPAGDHLDIVLTGDGAALAAPVGLGQLEDGAWHDALFEWDASARTLSVSLDGAPIASRTVDLQSIVGGSMATAAFTAGTGGVSNEHKVRAISLTLPADEPVGLALPVALVGDATREGTTFDLVDGTDSVGAVHLPGLVDLHGAFSLTLAYNAGVGGAAAGDGFGIAIHRAGTDALGLPGGNLGLVGLGDDDQLSIKIDLYDNGAVDGDIAGDHLSAFVGRDQSAALFAPVALGTVTDGAWHEVRLDWDPVADRLTLAHDGTPAGEVSGDVVRSAGFSGTQLAQLTVTGATGGGTHEGLVRIVDYTADTVGGSVPSFSLAGGATRSGDTVTLAEGFDSVGSFASDKAIDLSEDFALSFTVDGSGADGLAIALHADSRGPAALGTEGGNLSAKGIERLFAFEIDTFDNGPVRGDIAGTHTGIMRSDGDAMTYDGARPLAPAPQDIVVAIEWDVETELLSFYVDGNLEQQAGFNEVEAAIGRSDAAWLSVTAATGGVAGSWLVSDVTLSFEAAEFFT